jgi:hypothetical protein
VAEVVGHGRHTAAAVPPRALHRPRCGAAARAPAGRRARGGSWLGICGGEASRGAEAEPAQALVCRGGGEEPRRERAVRGDRSAAATATATAVKAFVGRRRGAARRAGRAKLTTCVIFGGFFSNSRFWLFCPRRGLCL